MFKKGVRIVWFLIIFGLAYKLMTASIVISIIIGLVLLSVAIIAIGRIGSRKADTKETEKKEPEKRETKTKETSQKKAEPVKETVKAETTGPATSKDHIKAATTALTAICCMDIRNAGMDVLKTAKNILKEKEEGNTCQGFAQFENYYLPTFRRTVENYSIMERKGVTDMKHREDLLEYLKSCDEAFTRIYNSMFEDEIMDMEVQMQAMNLTFRREGLL